MDSEKLQRVLRITGYISGLFTLFVAVILILGFVQLELIKPLENPAIEVLKEKYDADPNNAELKEQIRALDLMARRAFFATRWQLDTGSYLLLIGAAIFVLSQRLLIRNRRRTLGIPEDEFRLLERSKTTRKYLIISTASVVALAFVISFLLRNNMPAPDRVETELVTEGVSRTIVIDNQTPVAGESTTTEQDAVEDPGIETVTDTAPSLSQISRSVTSSEDQEQISEQSNTGNFPFFRGEGSRGYAPPGEYPVKWDGKTGENILWKVKVPKAGFSSPVIWGDKIYLTGAEGPQLFIMCFDKKNGDLLWTKGANEVSGEPAEPPKTSEDTGLAAPSAATNGTVVCAIFGNGNLLCFDMEGNRRWAKNLGVPDNHYGHSSSLIIDNNILVVQYDHFSSKSVMGFNVNSGEKLWETPRQVAVSWASPVIATFNGVKQVILSSEPFVIAYDIESGAEIWTARCMSGEVGPSVGVNSSHVFAVNDFAVLAAIDPNNNGNIDWQDNEYTPEVASPVATEELVYILTTWGGVAAYDAQSGEIAWNHDFDYGFYSSPMIAGNNVYMMDQAGVTHVVSTGKEFKLIAESPLGERANCTPAFSDGRIYLRSDEHLYCIGK